jgi:adenosylmethionine---8-amino-7-oxononanoate aminotransferase
MKNEIEQQDASFCWHPFTQAKNNPKNIVAASSSSTYIYDINGKRYIDAISSWWVNTHGHNHPHIVSAICKQSQIMSHVIFSGVTHQPAVNFARELIKKLPNPNLQHVFFTDNGSTAIEAALKMAIQYHVNISKNISKKTFLAFNGAYHGDTFGAMAVGKSSGFYTPFNDWLFDVHFIDYQCSYLNKPDNTQNILSSLAAYLEKNHANVAGFIFEPLIQGASGMRMCSIEFLNAILALCKRYSIICIADEVMTGFGRSGKLFACEYLEPSNMPDIICLSKGITGGALPFGVAVAANHIYKAFYQDDIQKAFLHGHSYTANPIACAAAIANLELFNDDTFAHISLLESIHNQQLSMLKNKFKQIKNIRCMGGIGAFDIIDINNASQEINYGSAIGQLIRLKMQDRGVLIRPLGSTIYILAPYCITVDDLKYIYSSICEVLCEVLNKNNAINSSSDIF